MGVYGQPASKAQCARVSAEHAVTGAVARESTEADELTVSEVLFQFLSGTSPCSAARAAWVRFAASVNHDSNGGLPIIRSRFPIQPGSPASLGKQTSKKSPTRIGESAHLGGRRREATGRATPCPNSFQRGRSAETAPRTNSGRFGTCRQRVGWRRIHKKKAVGTASLFGPSAVPRQMHA